jgi:putative oxygen-independent coproporphyrinogen III oxidase
MPKHHNNESLAQNLAVYIHWPFCKSKCPYCDFNSHVRDSVNQQDWKAALLSELDAMSRHVQGRLVTSIFFGGGTPSLMPPDTAQALIERVHTLWEVSPDIEITLEANPTSVEAGTFADFKKAGVNRVSLGVQSLNDSELKFLGRGHSAKEALAAVERARSIFDRYSFDLIYARPSQTVSDWEKELAEALTYAGKHLSLYQLTIEENTAFAHAYAKGGFTLPDDVESEALYRLTESMLADSGLRAYEVSNYAVPGEESRHNLTYWQGGDYIGIGPGAHGRITMKQEAPSADGGSRQRGAYAAAPLPVQQDRQGALNSNIVRSADRDLPPDRDLLRIATQTLKSPERWLEAVQRQGHGLEIWQEIEKQQEAEERIMMGLRLAGGIGYDEFTRRTGFPLAPYINDKKRKLYVRQGLLADDDSRLMPTLAGRLVLTRLTADLLITD